jgi:4-hydroxy-tetrahydrodipicolinate synthase
MFEGVIPILQTPFFEDGAIDFASLARQVDFAVEAGVEHICYGGFVSEWWKLSAEELVECVRVVVQAAAGRAGVIANVTPQSTFLAVEQARAFHRMGCAGLMCLPPFVVPRPTNMLLNHLRAVLAASPLPHVLQYSASLTGFRVEASALQALRAEYPHFGCIKVDFIPPGPVITDLREALGDGFTYLIGFAGLQLADCLKRGAHGLMGGTGHVHEDVYVYRQLRQDPEGAGLEAFHELLPLINFEMQTIDQSIATHKHLLKSLGVFSTGHVRQPGPHLDAGQAAELEAHWRRVRRPSSTAPR